MYQPMIWRIAKGFGMTDEDAADACQNTMVRLTHVVDQWSEHPPGKNSKFRGWLYRVAKNCMLRQFENDNRRISMQTNSEALKNHEPIARSLDTESQYQYEFRRQMFAFVARQIRPCFSERNWNAFWRTYVENENVSTVAKELGVKLSAVYVARSRVLKRFREEVVLLSGAGWGDASGLHFSDSVF